MAKQSYRTIWISDTHLCSRDCRGDELLQFLKHTKCEYLYLVGDFIDVWQMKRKWFWPQTYNNIVQKVLSKAKKGTQVTYIPGNHDDFFREFIGHQFGGVHVLSRAIHETADKKRLLVMHGDEFDAVVQCNRWLALVGSAAYDHLVSANRLFNIGRRAIGLPYWSLSAYIKGRVKNAVSYIGRFEEAAVREAIHCKVDGVVCGHIHKPAIRTLHDKTYCNTGDWVENCTGLVENFDGTLELINWFDLASTINRTAMLSLLDDDFEVATASSAASTDWSSAL